MGKVLKFIFNLLKKFTLNLVKRIGGEIRDEFFDIVNFILNFSLINLIVHIFIEMPLQALSAKVKGILEVPNKLKNAKEAIKKRIQKIKEIPKKMKKAIEKIKKIIKAIKAFIQALIHLIQVIIPILPYVAIFMVLIMMIWFVFSKAPALGDLFSFSYGFDKTEYYDNDLYSRVKSKEIMEENLYDRTSETSYYQRFANADIESLLPLVSPVLQEFVDAGEGNFTADDALMFSQQAMTGFYTLDSRLIAHDANMNSMENVNQGGTIDAENAAAKTTSGYLKDYFGKESNFELSVDFLAQLNNKAFADYGSYATHRVIYPEIFVKPIAYIDDFQRMDYVEYTDDKNEIQHKWEEYTYTTRRANLENIGKTTDTLFLGINEESYANYYGDTDFIKEITKEDNGKITSYPSPIVYEYIVSKKDDYDIYQIDTTTEYTKTVDNEYNSEYLTFINDETGLDEIAKFYYRVSGYMTEGNWTDSNGALNYGVSGNNESFVFDGPYLSIDDTAKDPNSVLSNKAVIDQGSYSDKKLEDDRFYTINIPEGYRLATDVAPFIEDENGNKTEQARTIDTVKVKAKYNDIPTKHVQLVNLTDNTGSIGVPSQNLINYKLFNAKTVTESYRNKSEYVNGWSEWLAKDENQKLLSVYTNKSYRDAVKSFWETSINVIEGWGKALNNYGNPVEVSTEGEMSTEEGMQAANESEAAIAIVASYPRDALNLSLYLYEKELCKTKPESEGVWTYNYSLNNYFKTDNANLQDREYFMKYFYLMEEFKLQDTTAVDGIAHAYGYSDAALEATKRYYRFENSNPEIDGFDMAADFLLGEDILEIITGNNALLGLQTKCLMDVLSARMNTAYLNTGSVNQVVPGLDAYYSHGQICGETVSGKKRAGEASLVGTTKVNSSLRTEALVFSSLKQDGTEVLNPQEDQQFELEFYNKITYNWGARAGNWLANKFGFSDKTDEDLKAESLGKHTIDILAQDHSHLQTSYVIKESDLEKNSSNIEDTQGNELSLEVLSVRDYGLGSILNYVDSVAVDFYSGVYYDEKYLGQRIGQQILTEFADVYDTYSFVRERSGNTPYSYKSNWFGKNFLTKEEYKVVNIADGFYPKEYRDRASDTLIEMFEQNNKKQFFMNITTSVEGKIFEVQSEYDERCEDPEKQTMDSLNGINYKDVDGLDSIAVDTEFYDKVNNASEITVTLDNGDGKHGTNYVGKNNNVLISDADIPRLEEALIFEIGGDVTDFHFYGPELILSNGPTSVSNLLVPKRYYRSWLTSLSNDSLNTGVNMDTTKEEVTWVDILLRLYLNKSDKLILSDAGETPETIELAIQRGLETYMSPYSLKYSMKGVYNDFGKANIKFAIENKLSSVPQMKKTGLIGSAEEDIVGYSKYLANNASDKFETGIPYLDYTTDEDVQKIYVVDEVATFAGRFMYTYRDTLLSTGETLDSDSSKSILSGYATDRYMFLDGWDIKLLSERAMDMDFYFFNVEYTLENQDKEALASIKDAFHGEGDYKDTLDSIQTAISQKASNFISYDGTFIFIVPPKYKDNYDNLFSGGLSNFSNEASKIGEFQEYTRIVSAGFLFNENSPKNLAPLTGVAKDGDELNLKYNIFNGDQIIDTNIDAVANDTLQGLTDEMWAEAQEKPKPYRLKILGPPTKEEFTSHSVDSTTGFLTSHFDEDGYNKAVEAWKNSQAWRAKFKKVKDKMGAKIQKAATDLITGFKIDDVDYANGYLSVLKSAEFLGANVKPTEFGDYLNAYTKILGQENLWNGSYESAFTFKYYLKKIYFNYNNGEDGDNADDSKGTVKLDWDEGHTGHARIDSHVYRYTLKLSDELTMNVTKGRFYSYLSNKGVIGSGGQAQATSNIDTAGVGITKPDPVIDFTDKDDYGELINVTSESLIKDTFQYVKGMSIQKYSGGNSLKQTVITEEIWRELWRPTLKVFDSLNEGQGTIYTSYDKDSMKEYLYGIYGDDYKESKGGSFLDSTYSETANKTFNGRAVQTLNHKSSYRYLPNGKKKFLFWGDATNYKMLNLLTGFNAKDGTTFTYSKTGANGTTSAYLRYLKGYKIKKSENYEYVEFSPDTYANKEELTINKDKAAVTDVSESFYLEMPTLTFYDSSADNDSKKLSLNNFIEIINACYKAKLKKIVSTGTYQTSVANEDFNITGFVLVPRLADRRDEPTMYPLFRYYGGTKKQIIPVEQVKYFEGQTFDSWKERMTINGDSSDEEVLDFQQEKKRISEYIETFLENFEAYIPYNILTDSDIEIRGTAGYGDLIVTDVLNPKYTEKYTSVFEMEAKKGYWQEFLTKYDIKSGDIADLLQGLAETAIDHSGEDGLTLLLKTNQEIEDSPENEDIIRNKVIESIAGNLVDTQVELKTTSGGTTKVTCPILGIAALDNIPDVMEEGILDETITNLNKGSETDNYTVDINSTFFIGDQMVNQMQASEVKIDDNHALTADTMTANSAINQMKSILKGSGDQKQAMDSSSAIYISVGFNDIMSTYQQKTYNLAPLKNLVEDIQDTYPTKPVIVQGVFPVATGCPTISDTEAFNQVVEVYNTKLMNFCNETKYVFYVNPNGGSTYSGLVNDDGSLNPTYANADGITLNKSGAGYYKRGIKTAITNNDEIISVLQDTYKDLGNGVKSTTYNKPVSKDLTAYETSLNLTESAGDGRLDREDAVAYMGLMLYKNSKVTGDLLKGCYAYFYGTDYVNALATVTANNTENLGADSQHGLWYSPTENDIRRAVELLGENYAELLTNSNKDIKESLGASRMLYAVSFVRNMENRKHIAVAAQNASAAGSATAVDTSAFENTGSAEDVAKKTAKTPLGSGSSQVFGGMQSNFTIIEYIQKVCNEFADEQTPLDPALFLAMIQQESGGNLNAKSGGGGIGLAQITGGTKNASAVNASGQKIDISISPSTATNGYLSIEYTVVNFVSAMRAVQDKRDSKEVSPLIIAKGHNHGGAYYGSYRDNYSSTYPLDSAGDLAFLVTYETPQSQEGVDMYKDYLTRYAGLSYASKASVNNYVQGQIVKSVGWGDPFYISNLLRYYVEEYSTGLDLTATSTASNGGYVEEIWEANYMKYQNSGVELYTNHMNGRDVEDLIKMTSIYRNDNQETLEYDYTVLDFFKSQDLEDAANNDFTGNVDSLMLNALTYLGANYSQPHRFSNAENITSDSSGIDLQYVIAGAGYYKEGATGYTGLRYQFDCSSFVSQMYLAMGYDLGNTVITLYNNFNSKWPNAKVGTDPVTNGSVGDIYLSNPTNSQAHAMLVGGTWATNYNNKLDTATLRIVGNQIISKSGPDALNDANKYTGQPVRLHCGYYPGSNSAVNVSKYSTKNGFVYRVFWDDVPYNEAALTAAGLPCPTVFSSTTIKNNPYLVEYMQESGIYESELAKGHFTTGDVAIAKRVIAKANGEEIDEEGSTEEGEETESEEENE